MILFDSIQNHNRFICDTVLYNKRAYLRVNKMYLDKKTGEWHFTPQTVMMNSECAEEFITAIQSVDVLDVLIDMDKLEKGGK